MESHHNESAKRFVLQKEEFVQEKIAAIKTAVEEMQAEYPETIGLSFFGSLVKGRAHPKSDIDAMLLIDPDRIPEDMKNEEEKGPPIEFKQFGFHEKKEEEIYESSYRWPQFRRDVEERYKESFRGKILKHLSSSDESQVRDVLVEPLNEKLITHMLGEIVESYRKYPDGVKQHTIRFSRQIRDVEKAARILDDVRIEPNQLLYMLFHLNVGGGLPYYRKLILDRLSQEGEIGEKIWDKLIYATESWEEKTVNIPTDKRYPRTLAEAIKVYG